MLIWDSFVGHTDDGTIAELEKKIYDEFIFAAQLSRGKLSGINVK